MSEIGRLTLVGKNLWRCPLGFEYKIAKMIHYLYHSEKMNPFSTGALFDFSFVFATCLWFCILKYFLPLITWSIFVLGFYVRLNFEVWIALFITVKWLSPSTSFGFCLWGHIDACFFFIWIRAMFFPVIKLNCSIEMLARVVMCMLSFASE